MAKKKQTAPKKKPSFNAELPVITTVALAAVLLLIAASGYWSYDRWIAQVQQERLAQYSQQQAKQRADDIAFYIQEQQKQLNNFSERSAILRATRNTNPEMTASLINNLKTAYPDALSFKLLNLDRNDHLVSAAAPESDTPEPTNTLKPLSFTELDMINRAERQQAVPPEALKIGKQWYLHFIAPVVDPTLNAMDSAPADTNTQKPTASNNDQTSTPAPSDASGVTATLLITLPATELFQRIRQKAPELGQTQLMRDNTGQPVSIFTASQGDVGPAVTSSVADSEWLIRFTPSDTLAAQAAESPLLLILIHLVVGGALLGLVYWLTGKFDPQRLSKDLAATQSDNRHAQPDMSAHLNNRNFQDHDILDLHVAEEDENLLGLQEKERSVRKASQSTEPVTEQIELPDEIFRAYDIRGLAHTQITPELAQQVGQAVASEALAAGDSSLFVARDGRNHSPELCEALIAGILSTGCDVINLGAIPTPLLYFATCELPDSNSGVMVTASHNAAEYNGFKMVINGRTLVDTDVQNIKTRIQTRDVFGGQGTETSQQVIPEYIDRIFSDVALAGDVKLVIDAGNGITGGVAPQLFEELGCDVEALFCDIDGSFPNHDPDPTIEANLQELIRTVQSTEADLGVAFDGDGDRLVLVTPKGQIIWPDRLLMLFAKDIVARNPGADVLFDVKCTRELNSLVSSYGGRPIMWKAGHSNMKTKMQETGALVGGEMSGHIFIKDRWYGFDDGMYAAARLLEIMTLRDQDMDSLFDSFPNLPSTPELKIPVAETRKFELVEQLVENGDFQNGRPITIDGLRVDFPKGWGLVRASNTSAALTLRFEAETEEVLVQLQELFKRELLKIDSSLDIPF
ncbi:phosphomannomutase/phosphoglucomutase [Pseudomaricurvus sp.]|uniref:phosphomannomutase/phosphoglucomutase n=1 Tax=Pseudomaricurvus sp. TaxID=2004510 RepID=UPI003F6D899A